MNLLTLVEKTQIFYLSKEFAHFYKGDLYGDLCTVIFWLGCEGGKERSLQGVSEDRPQLTSNLCVFHYSGNRFFSNKKCRLKLSTLFEPNRFHPV